MPPAEFPRAQAIERVLLCSCPLMGREPMRPVSGSSNSSPVHNCLLAALLPADFALMRRHFRPPVLALKQDIERPNRRIEFVCFVKTASVVAVQSETRVEVGLIGREGMSGTAVGACSALCRTTPTRGRAHGE